jgi:hypothetical protein
MFGLRAAGSVEKCSRTCFRDGGKYRPDCGYVFVKFPCDVNRPGVHADFLLAALPVGAPICEA